jgi:paraquat-inducible protein A
MKLTRNTIGFVLVLISLVILFPGVSKPVLTVKTTFDASILSDVPYFGAFLQGKLIEQQTTLSVIGSIRELWNQKLYLVSSLILFFSIIVPAIKAVMLLFALALPWLRLSRYFHGFVNFISKWAMADVFVVGITLGFLTFNGNPILGAELHEGYYYFLTYCLISILAAQIIRINPEVRAKEEV